MFVLSGLPINQDRNSLLNTLKQKNNHAESFNGFFFDFFIAYFIFCFISQIQFQTNMESYSEYVFQLPTTQDSLAEFRRKTNQQPENIKNIEDINPQSLPPLTIIPRRRRRQRSQVPNTTIIRVKPSQQITPQQKKQSSYPPFVYEDLQQSIVSKKIQESFTVSQKSQVYIHKMSTKQTKQLDHKIVSYNSQQQYQEQLPRLPRYQEVNHQVKSKQIMRAENLTALIKMKVPQKYAIKCLVKITKRMFSATVYDLYLQQDKKLLLRAIKSPVPFTRTFIVSDPTTKKQLCKVFKNFTGTQYILVDYDNEKNKQKQILWISYRLNIFGLAGQNTINVLRPKREILKTDKFSDIKARWENGNRKKIEVFTNKLAIKKNGNYQMDFHGMVTTPSSKNFIIDDENGLECLLFGKRTSDIFALNVTNSMTILEAFAMALSSLDGKLLVH